MFAALSGLMLSVCVLAGAAAPAAFAPSGQAVPFPRELSLTRPADTVWMASGGGVIWFVDPTTNTIGRFPADRREALQRVPWPKSLSPDHAGRLALGASSAQRAWLVDRDAQRLFLLEGVEWRGPWPTGEVLASVTALADGRLVANTPRNTAAAFATFAPDGRLVARFGSRVIADAAMFDEVANTWVLATLVDGTVIAAHSFRPLLRRYNADGKLLWEKPLSTPEALRLEAIRQAAQHEIVTRNQGCCLRAKLPVFATSCVAWSHTEFFVRLGLGTVLEKFGADGTWAGTSTVVPAAGSARTSAAEPPEQARQQTRSVWATAGLAGVGDVFWAAEPAGLIEYHSTPPATLGGVVQDNAGKPIGGATVRVRLGGAEIPASSTADDGSFSVAVASSDRTGVIEVRADDFQSVVLTGVIAELIGKPIVLQPAWRLCVRVRDEGSAAPVTTFRLSVDRQPLSSTTGGLETGPSVSVTNPEGEACLLAPWPPPILLRVAAEGYAVAEVRTDQKGKVDIKLEREAIAAIHVRSAAEEPVVSARVSLEPLVGGVRAVRQWLPHQVSETNGDGNAEFKGLNAARYRLVVEHSSWLPYQQEIALETGRNQLDATLSRGATLRVQVVEGIGHKPVPGATVELLGVTGLGAPSGCTTDDMGRCSVRPVPMGSFNVIASASGRASVRQRVPVAAEDTLDVVLRLPSGVRLLGRVLGTENYPETELAVEVARPGQQWEAPVDATSAFAVNDVPPGELQVWVVERGMGTSLITKQVVVPRDARDHEVVLELPPPVIVRGRITVDGRGCGACQALFSRAGVEVDHPEIRARVLPDGAYEARVPSKGTYAVEVRDENSDRELNRTISVSGSVAMDLDLAPLRVSGRVVVGEARRPAPRAPVQLIELKTGQKVADTVSGDDGGFALTASSTGEHRALAWFGGASGSGLVQLPVVEGELVEIQVPEQPALRLRVLDAQSGAPLSRINVRVISASREGVTHVALSPSESGVFEIPAFSAVPLTVVVESLGFARATIRGVVPSPAPLVVALPAPTNLRLVVGAGLPDPCAVEVQDAGGQPVALSIGNDPGPVPLFVREAIISSLEPGRFTVALRPCTGTPMTSQVNLPPGSLTTVSFGLGGPR